MAPHARVWCVGRAELRAYRVRKQFVELIERELDRPELERRVEHGEHGNRCERQCLLGHHAVVRAADPVESPDRS